MWKWGIGRRFGFLSNIFHFFIGFLCALSFEFEFSELGILMGIIYIFYQMIDYFYFNENIWEVLGDLFEFLLGIFIGIKFFNSFMEKYILW